MSSIQRTAAGRAATTATATSTSTSNRNNYHINGNGHVKHMEDETETHWLSKNPSKRRGEIFFLAWSPIWMIAMGMVVITRAFDHFSSQFYLIWGCIIGLPPIILPLLFPGQDRHVPIAQRYTTKANAWIFIMAFISNYLWTHYFYHVLHCRYTFIAWRLNDVPFCLYLITHSYFATYHVMASCLLRRLWQTQRSQSRIMAYVVVVTFIAVFSYVVAFLEAFSIQNFEHYYIPDRWAMYVYGSVFYALYFIVSFPMFLRLDENIGECWSLSRAIIDGFAACMMITQLLDFWRLFIGPIPIQSNIQSIPVTQNVSFIQ